MNLKNKSFVITGGSQGIGRAIGFELAGRGANLALIARNRERLEETAGELSRSFPAVKIHTFAADVGDHVQVEQLARQIEREIGAVDGLINNAGLAYSNLFTHHPLSVFEDMMRVKYLGAVYMTRALLPLIVDGGYISFTSSVVGYMGLIGYTGYAGPNYALFGLAESLAQELMARKINVSVLCPPDTETPGLEEENKTKPYETRTIAATAKLMNSEVVARRFVAKMLRGLFLITVNFESALLYRLSRLAPALFRWVVKSLVRRIQRKKPPE